MAELKIKINDETSLVPSLQAEAELSFVGHRRLNTTKGKSSEWPSCGASSTKDSVLSLVHRLRGGVDRGMALSWEALQLYDQDVYILLHFLHNCRVL